MLHSMESLREIDKAIPTYFYVSHRYGSLKLGRSVGKEKKAKKMLATTFKDTKLKRIKCSFIKS